MGSGTPRLGAGGGAPTGLAGGSTPMAAAAEARRQRAAAEAHRRRARSGSAGEMLGEREEKEREVGEFLTYKWATLDTQPDARTGRAVWDDPNSPQILSQNRSSADCLFVWVAPLGAILPVFYLCGHVRTTGGRMGSPAGDTLRPRLVGRFLFKPAVCYGP
jgi:hypothetical protein